MKTNSVMKKITAYLTELTIVTIGVLIALFLSNLKENNQAEEYQIASVETIKNEVKENYSHLKEAIEKQTSLLDTVKQYSEEHISIYDLLLKSGGLQMATLSNAGLEFYKRNRINSIDFELMSTLINMNFLSKLIDTKIEKLADYVYPNTFIESKESKRMIIMYLRNALESEKQLLQVYKNFTDKYAKTSNNK